MFSRHSRSQHQRHPQRLPRGDGSHETWVALVTIIAVLVLVVSILTLVGGG